MKNGRGMVKVPKITEPGGGVSVAVVSPVSKQRRSVSSAKTETCRHQNGTTLLHAKRYKKNNKGKEMNKRVDKATTHRSKKEEWQ